jgi:hypothetical protein
MKRLHVHVSVGDLTRAVGFYSGLLGSKPCCGGANFANWRVDEPPVNFAASLGHGPVGALHFGLEVDHPRDLPPIDRLLQGAARSAAAVRWEVSVRKQPVKKEVTS